VRTHREVGKGIVVRNLENANNEGVAAEPAMTPLMTVRDVAKLLQMHEKTIYEWVEKGQLPCIRLGKRLRFAASDITRWVASHRGGR
jgi:excisionase family DNA binding protein